MSTSEEAKRRDPLPDHPEETGPARWLAKLGLEDVTALTEPFDQHRHLL